MYRQFKIVNSIGEEIDLNGTEELFVSPAGLGYVQQNNMAAIGSGFYKNAKKSYPARNIVGMIVFAGDDPYTQYREFVNFVNKGYDLTMKYKPNEPNEYLCDIDIEYINKTELKVGVLECPVSFYAKTPWYQKTPQTIRIVPGGGGNISKFDVTFDFAFVGEATNGTAQIQTLGHLPASLEIVVPGPVTNPSIKLVSSDGTVEGLMTLAAEIDEGSTLRYSSKYLDTGVWIDGEEQIEALDMNNENFFRVPTEGVHSLVIETEGVADINATVYIYNYYRSV